MYGVKEFVCLSFTKLIDPSNHYITCVIAVLNKLPNPEPCDLFITILMKYHHTTSTL